MTDAQSEKERWRDPIVAEVGTNVVLLDPDVAAAFPNADAVNRALRALLSIVPPRRANPRSA